MKNCAIEARTPQRDQARVKLRALGVPVIVKAPPSPQTSMRSSEVCRCQSGASDSCSMKIIFLPSPGFGLSALNSCRSLRGCFQADIQVDGSLLLPAPKPEAKEASDEGSQAPELPHLLSAWPGVSCVICLSFFIYK